MFPGVYGFSWSVGNVIFLGIFYAVILAVMCTMAMAGYRALRDFRSQKDEAIRWHVDFADLPATARVCRHELAGEVKHRTCNNEFECGTCTTHPKFLGGGTVTSVPFFRDTGDCPPSVAAAADVFGFQVPPDCLYHRGHTWVRLEEDGTATVGLDDFGARLVGKPDHVTLPPIGSRLPLNGTGWQITRSGSTIRVLAPIEGEVVEIGGPDRDWYLRLKPVEAAFETRHLLHGAEIRPWILREMERLQLALAVEGVGLSLADGGEVVGDVPGAYPEANWDAIWGDMFLEP